MTGNPTFDSRSRSDVTTEPSLENSSATQAPTTRVARPSWLLWRSLLGASSVAFIDTILDEYLAGRVATQLRPGVFVTFRRLTFGEAERRIHERRREREAQRLQDAQREATATEELSRRSP